MTREMKYNLTNQYVRLATYLKKAQEEPISYYGEDMKEVKFVLEKGVDAIDVFDIKYDVDNKEFKLWFVLDPKIEEVLDKEAIKEITLNSMTRFVKDYIMTLPSAFKKYKGANICLALKEPYKTNCYGYIRVSAVVFYLLKV